MCKITPERYYVGIDWATGEDCTAICIKQGKDQIIHIVKPYMLVYCPSCKKKTKTKRLISVHRTRTGRWNAIYECEQCGKQKARLCKAPPVH